MKKRVIIYLLLSIVTSQLYSKNPFRFYNGDLIFQNVHCGPMCDAINEVTKGYKGRSFSHVGIVWVKRDSIFVIEAISKGVSVTPINDFLKRSHEVVIGRIKRSSPAFLNNVIKESLKYLGKPYDDNFDINNDAYYCSELVYFAFKHANHNIPFFELHPMTYKSPKTKKCFPVWVDYFKALNIPIPEGKPGINPGGISRSEKLEMYLDLLSGKTF